MDEHQKQTKDAKTIFTAISTSFDNYKEAKRAVVFGYVTDMSFSRAGISLALKQLEKHYNSRGQSNEEVS